MFGLVQSLEAQGQQQDAAAEERAMFDKVWAGADITLTGSRL